LLTYTNGLISSPLLFTFPLAMRTQIVNLFRERGDDGEAVDGGEADVINAMGQVYPEGVPYDRPDTPNPFFGYA
jgi:hypothetical protein